MDKTEKTADEIRLEAEQSIKNLATETTKAEFEKRMKDITLKYDEQLEKGATKEDLEKANKSMKADIDKLSAEVKKQSQMGVEKVGKMSMVGALKETIKSNVDVLKSFNGGQANLASKAAIVATDFGTGGYELITTEVKPLYTSPYAPVWLRNVFPTTTTSGGTIKYLQRDTPVGGADIFTRGTDERKATFNPKYKVAVAVVETIAATTDVPTEMLQDVDFIGNTIPQDLVYSAQGLLARENKMIMDYIEANAVDFTADADFAINLEKVLGAGYGQLLSEYMQPTHILINNWDYLKALAFNKAEGSGEYDSVNFIGGNLYINSLIAVPVPAIEEGTAYVVAANESQFVSRMNPEVRMFEQNKDNVETNMVTFRAEERAAFFTKNVNSLVKVAFTYAEVTP